jgi:hypothetical protein
VIEAAGLAAAAWIVYFWDAVWWVTPDRVVLTGSRPGEMRAQLGPTLAVNGERGIYIPRLIPPFEPHIEVSLYTPSTARVKDAAVVAAVQEAFAAARPLRLLGTSLWGLWFVAAPLLIVSLGLLRVWLPVAVAILALTLVTVATFARAWRRLYPRDRRGWWGKAMPMILSPLEAICAADALTRPVCAQQGGFAAAAALASREEFLRLARLCYFPSGDHRQLDAVLSAKGLTEALFAPPERSDPEMQGYCPRCHTQLMRSDGPCPECKDVAIVGFGSPMLSGASFGTFQSAAPR